MTFRHLVPAAALAALLLAGCASVPRPGTPVGSAAPDVVTAWQQHLVRTAGIGDFALDARIAASGSFGVTGTLHWEQHDATFSAHFAGPLGTGAVDITGDPEVVLIHSGKDQYATAEPERFLLKHFGWTLPLQGLRYWVLGIPASGRTPTSPPALTLNPDGTLRTLLQDGWDIGYPEYQTTESRRLPRKITMQGGKTQFRIVIDHWTLTPTNGA